MLKMDPEAKLPWAIKMVNLTENVKNLNEDESAEAGFLIRPLSSDFLRFLSPNPLLMYIANVKDSENTDRWLAALSSAIVN